MHKVLLFFCLLVVLSSTALNGQEILKLTNPSFEDKPHQGTITERVTISGWFDCGRMNFPHESPPDIHPGSFWNNNIPPSQGKSYIGMVVRDNDSWESVSQRLDKPLLPENCYFFSVDLCRSPTYLSKSRLDASDRQYITPTVFRVWGGNAMCDQAELLVESAAIDHTDWRRYQFKINSTKKHQYITIEAFYKTPTFLPYCGHILVDNLSDFKVMKCSENIKSVVKLNIPTPDIAQNDPVVPAHKKSRVTASKEKEVEKPTHIPNPPTPKPDKKSEKKVLTELDNKTLKAGSVVTIKNLTFAADSSRINLGSHVVLDEIVEFLQKNQNISVEIGGHTNGIPPHDYCDKLSTERAKAVYDYLLQNGVSKNQMTYKGYGKRKKIASDDNASGRQKNQRVELKVIST